jgi:hypothetical protein
MPSFRAGTLTPPHPAELLAYDGLAASEPLPSSPTQWVGPDRQYGAAQPTGGPPIDRELFMTADPWGGHL